MDGLVAYRQVVEAMARVESLKRWLPMRAPKRLLSLFRSDTARSEPY